MPIGGAKAPRRVSDIGAGMANVVGASPIVTSDDPCPKLMMAREGNLIAPGLLEARKCRVGGRRHVLVVMVNVPEAHGRDHADLAVESSVVEPVDVFRGRDLKVVDVLPGPAVADQFGLVEGVKGLGQGVDVEEPTEATAPASASRSV